VTRPHAALLLVLAVACHDPDDGDEGSAASAFAAIAQQPLPELKPSPPTASAGDDPIHESNAAIETAAFDGLQGVWRVTGSPGLFGKKGQVVIIRGRMLALESESIAQDRVVHRYETRKTMRLLRAARPHSLAFDLDHRGDFAPEHPVDADAQAVGAASKGWSRRASARFSPNGRHLTLALASSMTPAPPFAAGPQVELIELER
jgi:hypothetical protein